MSDSRPDTEMTVTELATRLETGADVQVLDVRAEHRLASGVVEVRSPATFHNVRGSEVLAAGDPAALGLDRDRPVAVVCGRGNDSLAVARFLAGHGYDARSMAGGILDWMRMLVPRDLEAPPGFDRFVQFDRLGKASLSYVLISDDEAIVIDPPRNLDPIVAPIEEAGARIVAVADTHVHADYLSGAPRLALAACVPYLLHPGDAEYPYDGTPGKLDFAPLADGQRLRVGRGSIEVMHSPGHTLGSVTFVAGGSEAMTGDFLFIESIGRPDLAGRAEAWTPDLWQSLERVRRTWGDDVGVRPAHYASDSERNDDRTIGRPWGRLRQDNEVLGIGNLETFRRWILERTVTPPDAYPKIKAANIGLLLPTPEEADELEAGKNECAVG